MPLSLLQRRAVKVGAVALLLSFSAALLALFLVEPVVRGLLLRAARERGVDLQFDTFDLELGRIELQNARFSLRGVDGVRATCKKVDLFLTGLDVALLEADQVGVSITGTSAAIAVDVARWTKDYPTTSRLPVRATNVNFAWQTDPGARPWLVLEHGQVERTGQGGTFRATAVQLAGADVGEVQSSWTSGEADVRIGFAGAADATAPIRIVVRHAASPPTADVSFRSLPLERLSGPLGVAFPAKGIGVSGDAHLVFRERAGLGGTLDVKLEGFVPPHPAELQGFLFGDHTRVTTRFSTPPERERILLEDMLVQAGSFRLKGSGTIVSQPDHASVTLDLIGALSCVEVLGAAANTHLGKVVGAWVKQAARQAVAGFIQILVRVDADTRALADARVIRTITPGCGLKPLPLPDLHELPKEWLELPGKLPALPPELALPSGLPALPSALPPLPTSLPSLPKLPSALPPPALPKLPELPRLPRADRDAGR